MMTQLCEHLQGRGEVEALSRARIQPMGDGIQLALRIARQVRPLGQVLAQQAIGVLIGPALPGAMRIRKEHLDREPLGQPFMFRHLSKVRIASRSLSYKFVCAFVNDNCVDIRGQASQIIIAYVTSARSGSCFSRLSNCILNDL